MARKEKIELHFNFEARDINHHTR